MDKKVSIIVPVRNIERYLPKCLDTLINQTLKEIEIICINDGSTDSSINILKEYANEDSRIIIIDNKESRGQAFARNRGLEIAKGEYIGFVDGDDWVDETMFEKLYNSAIEDNTDITMCANSLYDEFAKATIKDNAYYNLDCFDSSFDGKVFSHYDTKNFLMDINVVLWNKLYKREFMENISARFIEDYIYEDLPFFFYTYLKARRVNLIRDNLYYYRINRQGSTMANDGAKILDRIDMALVTWHILYNAPYYNEINNRFMVWFIDDIFHRFTLADSKYQKEYFFRMKKIFSLLETSGIDTELLYCMFSYSDYLAVKKLPYRECNRIFLSNYKKEERDTYILREYLTNKIEDKRKEFIKEKESYFEEFKEYFDEKRKWYEQKVQAEVDVQIQVIRDDYESRLESQGKWFERELGNKLYEEKQFLNHQHENEINHLKEMNAIELENKLSEEKKNYETELLTKLEEQRKSFKNETEEQLKYQKEWFEKEIEKQLLSQKEWFDDEYKSVKPVLKLLKKYQNNFKRFKRKFKFNPSYIESHKPKISIILPVYNVGKYLRQSLDSLINQTLEDIEMICVNDGSTDDSAQILDEYSKKDPRIKVIHKENAGTGAARNDGLKIARGECIGFVDPDDWVKDTMFERLYGIIKEHNADIAMCMPDGYNEGKQVFQTFGYFVDDNFVKVKEKVEFNWMEISPFSYPMCIWNKLYKKELIDKHNIEFAEGLDFEDHKLIFKSLLTANKVHFIPEKLYVYRHNRPGSILSDNDKRLLDHMKIFDIVENILKETNTYETLRNDFISYKIHNLLYYYSMIKEEHKEDYYQSMLESVKETNLSERELESLYKNYPDLKPIIEDIKTEPHHS